MDEHGIPGLCVGINVKGEPIYRHGFGFRDVERNLPVSENVIFGIGSVTKSFTAMAILQLQERGKLSVHDPVLKYLPEFRTPDGQSTDKVTVHQLLSHTSGLPSLPSRWAAVKSAILRDPTILNWQSWGLLEKLGETPQIDTIEQMLDYIRKSGADMAGEPGTCFSYNNDGYALLGAVIERVSQQSYVQFIHNNIIEPAGMTKTTFDSELARDRGEASVLYIRKPNGGVESSHMWLSAPVILPTGYLLSCVEDLVRYMEIFRTGGCVGNERVLTPASVEAMMTPYAACGPRAHYGYGLILSKIHSGRLVVEHGGSIKGVSAHIMFLPDLQLTGVVLANVTPAPVERVLQGFINSLDGVPVDTPPCSYPTVPISQRELSAYVGEYPDHDGGNKKVVLEAGRLFLELRGKRHLLRPVGNHLFMAEVEGSEIPVSFYAGKTGEIHSLHLYMRLLHRRRP